MGTWLGVIANTRGIPEFWGAAAAHNVQRTPGRPATPRGDHVYIGGEWGGDFEAPARLARSISRELGSDTLAFTAQTGADVHTIASYRLGERVGALAYSRDGGGWLEVTGEPQAWESAYLFAGPVADDDGDWPDMLHDDISDEDIARYSRALAANDPRAVIDLLHPSAMAPLLRVFGCLGLDPERPDGRWHKPSIWRRMFGRA